MGEPLQLHVTIRQSEATSTHHWTPTKLIRYLAGIMENRGVNLCIHGSDGTQIKVYPRCKKCGWYNTLKPLSNGLCEDCKLELEEKSDG
jgi:hypothetical protein